MVVICKSMIIAPLFFGVLNSRTLWCFLEYEVSSFGISTIVFVALWALIGEIPTIKQ